MDLEKLYNDYFSVVYKYILSVSLDPLTAEEITQDVNKIYYVPKQYVKLLKNFERDKLDAAKDEFVLVWEAN